MTRRDESDSGESRDTHVDIHLPGVERTELHLGNFVHTVAVEHPSGTYAWSASVAGVDDGMIREAIAGLDLWLDGIRELHG